MYGRAKLLPSTCIGLLCMLLPPVHAQPLAEALHSILDDPATSNAWWGAYVIDLASDEPVFAWNATRSFMPASGTKLFTTAAVLDLLGPDYQYETRLFTDGTIDGDILHGNLIARGSGDPSIGSEHVAPSRIQVFNTWAKTLREAGIRQITGNVIGDDDIFDDTPLGLGWAWDDGVYGYAAQISGLSFHDNIVELTAKAQSHGAPAAISWEPLSTDYITVIDSTNTIERGAALSEGYSRAPGTNTIHLFSEIPQGQTDLEKLAVHNPTQYFVHVLHTVLESHGIAVEGDPMDTDDLPAKIVYPSLQLLAHHLSPPLSELVSVANKESQNLYAELLLRTLGAEYPTLELEWSAGSAEQGIAAAMATFAAAAIDTSRLQLVDGSGLSRKNLVTPTMVVQLLRYMAHHEDAQVRTAFEKSLAVAGRDGPLEFRFLSRDGPTVRLYDKTGTLGNVSTLSGYLHTQGGRRLAFAVMCNHYAVPSRTVRRIQDHFLTTLARKL